MDIYVLLFLGGVIAALALRIRVIRNETIAQLGQMHGRLQDLPSVQNELQAVRGEVSALREQLIELRDTTTQYDLSFDTALQRMQQQLDHEVQQRLGK